MDPFEKINSVEFIHTFGFSSVNFASSHPQGAGKTHQERLQGTPTPGPVHNSAGGDVQPMISRFHRAQGIDGNRDPSEINASSIPDAAATPA
jgi:hypothetical protein